MKHAGEKTAFREPAPSVAAPVTFGYFLSSLSEAVEENGALWHSPFPISRNPQKTGPGDPAGMELTYGDYFLAVRRFLEDRKFRVVTKAISEIWNRPCGFRDITAVRVFLVKHGQFYHPSRVQAQAGGQVFNFVLNVALSSSGKSCIQREFDILSRMSRMPCGVYLPKGYGYGELCLPKGQSVKLFLGQWFDDFHEFHMSLDPEDKHHKIRLWDGVPSLRFLSSRQTLELYRQIAVILTECYDPDSFMQVFPWHHAAGDFIVSCSNSLLQARLITVRQYGALFDSPDKDDAALLDAMLFFLVNLSIRTRLDRLDGVGDVVWAGLPAVEGTVQGFMEALSVKIPRRDLQFRKYSASVSLSAMTEACEAVADSYHPLAPELAVIRYHLDAHAAELSASLMAFST